MENTYHPVIEAVIQVVSNFPLFYALLAIWLLSGLLHFIIPR